MKTLKKEQCLIARFMELKECCGVFEVDTNTTLNTFCRVEALGPTGRRYYTVTPEELNYSKSWDWLMPVVSKLCKSGIRARYPQTEDIISEVENISGTSSIKDVHTLVIAAITRYNNSIGFDA